MSLFDNLSGYWFRIQDSLFPWMEERIGELTNKQLQLVTVLEIIRLQIFTKIISKRVIWSIDNQLNM